MNRRKFLLLLSAAAATAAVRRASADEDDDREKFEPPEKQVFDAGPLSAFPAAKLYAEHRRDGFFIVRRDGEVFALSSVCTHKGCLVKPEPDGSFQCPCHHAHYAPDGSVTKGPAKRPLARLGVKLDEQKHVLVNLEARPKVG